LNDEDLVFVVERLIETDGAAAEEDVHVFSELPLIVEEPAAESGLIGFEGAEHLADCLPSGVDLRRSDT